MSAGRRPPAVRRLWHRAEILAAETEAKLKRARAELKKLRAAHKKAVAERAQLYHEADVWRYRANETVRILTLAAMRNGSTPEAVMTFIKELDQAAIVKPPVWKPIAKKLDKPGGKR